MTKIKTFKLLFIYICLLAYSTSGFSQAGGGVYQILDIPMDARSIALGGINVSIQDGYVPMAISNPALLSRKAHNTISLSYANYLSTINYGSVAYAYSLSEQHNFGISINYLDFGKFKGYDELDNYQGDFRAKDIFLSLIYSYHFGKYFTVGSSLKPIYSTYENYWSAGMALDFGANYHNEDILLDLGLAVKNIGFQFNSYSDIPGDKNREALPLNIVFGLSKKLQKAPFRLSFTIHNMQKFYLGYEKAKYSDSQYTSNNTPKWHDMLFRHSIFAVEILPTKNFYLSVAFNYRRRAEMTIPAFRSLAGFSFGAGLKVRGFGADFAATQMQSGRC